MSETATQEMDFWSCSEDDEQLTASTIEEAVEMWADKIYPHPMPDEITVYGWRRRAIDQDAEQLQRWINPLDRVLEVLDDEYGNPDESTEPTAAMKEAERTFLKSVATEYFVWRCEIETQQVVRVADYYDPRP